MGLNIGGAGSTGSRGYIIAAIKPNKSLDLWPRLCYLVGRGDFDKKSEKVSAYWNMAAVTVIRLLGYMGMPSCTALYCRRRNLGGETTNQLLSTHLPKILVQFGSVWFNAKFNEQL